jgi:SNF2 family DNA or RNA helicase
MKAVLKDNEIHITDSFDAKDLIKEIPGRRWSPAQKAWIIPVTVEAIDSLRRIRGHIDPEINKIYADMIKTQVATDAIRLSENIKPIEPMPVKVKPFQHQVRGYNMALENNAFGYLFEMGCGKTLTSLATVGRRYLRGEVTQLLIVAPKSVVYVWPKEFDEYADFPVECKVLEGSTSQKVSILKSFREKGKLRVAVINYESTWRMLDELISWKPDMIIADESQRIKSPSAEQSKAMHKLGKVAKYKLILSGTPVQNSPLDVFSQWKFLDERIFGTSYYAFRARYAVLGGYGNHQVVGYNNLDELIKKAHSISYRVTKEEALDLPETTDEYRYCELEPKARKIYEQIRRESYAELERGEVIATNILTKLLRLQQITGGYLTSEDGATVQISKTKLEALFEIVEDVVMDSGKKIVIFARFLPEIDAIKALLDGKAEYSYITGDVKDRGEQVRRFQEDPNVKVFIAQIQTAGLGITLHAADTAVFYSLDFNLANYQQSRARIHRIGQRNACTYIHLIAPGTVDEKIMKALAIKEDMAKRVVDSWRDYFGK